ncbi:MAG TPA: M56 family metallopeptidase [Gemmataceae bacterium]|nr:M56 family metallopeptidase [Gemmataceae bacterium]
MDDLLSIAVSNAVAATVLALAALAVGAVHRRPALVHGLWLLVLLKLVTPPLVFLPIAWPASAEPLPPEVASIREEPADVSPVVAEEAAAPVVDPPAGEEEPAGVEAAPVIAEPAMPPPAMPPQPSLWPQMLRIVWGAGALLWFLLALERLHHFRRLLRFARPAPAALQERTLCLAHSLGLKRCPRVRLLPGRIAPMLWAIGGPPRLLVPADLLDVLSDEQLDTLLLHELAHLRRRDHWVRVLEFVVMGLYWWHPVVWFARRELREAEEQCCDAWVVSTLPGAGRTYASALLDTLDFLSTAQAAVPPLASGLGQIADLKRRLTMIMQENTPRSLTWPGCLAVVALGLTILPMLPSLHGEPPGKEEAQKQIEEAEQALKQAQAEMEHKRALLAQKRAELAQAEKQLKLQEDARKAQRKIVRSYVITTADGNTGKLLLLEGGKKATYRIEFTLPADADVKLNDIIEKIGKVLPEELRDKIDVRITPVADHEIQLRKTPQPAGSADQTRIGQPPAQTTPRSQPPVKDSRNEKRINDLEKKLEKVLRELHDLRKQIGYPPPGVPVPPGFTMPPTGSIPYSPANPAPATPPTPAGGYSPVPPSTSAPPAPPQPANPFRPVAPKQPGSGDGVSPPPPPRPQPEPER